VHQRLGVLLVPPPPRKEDEPSGFLGDLMDHLADLVGPAAGAAMFHYAAFKEGQRLGAQAAGQPLPEALRSLDAVLQHRSRVLVEEAAKVVVEVTQSPFLAAPSPTREAVATGLLEGFLHAHRGIPFHATITRKGGALFFELRRAA